MKQFRILLVDDEEKIVNFLAFKLKAAGYEVLTASNGLEALEQAHAEEPDMVVLDVVMPKMDGMVTLKELRRFSSVPVIVLSARGSDDDKITGLGLGADDYLAKPFNPDELIARIDAVRRRMEGTEDRKLPGPLSLGDLTIDFEKRSVTISGEPLQLTRIEWLLLNDLSRNIGRLMPYEMLLTRVWGAEYRDDVQLLRTWVSRLRSKLKQGPNSSSLIRTIPKTGYIMDNPSD